MRRLFEHTSLVHIIVGMSREDCRVGTCIELRCVWMFEFWKL